MRADSSVRYDMTVRQINSCNAQSRRIKHSIFTVVFFFNMLSLECIFCFFKKSLQGKHYTHSAQGMQAMVE